MLRKSRLILIFLSFLLCFQYAKASLEDMFQEQTSIKDPFKMRDPFQTPKFKSADSQKRRQLSKGILDNVEKFTEKFDLDRIQIVGVLIGKERRIIVKTKGSEKTFILKEGEHFGVDGPVIKAILPGGVMLVETIRNIYGEREFIETVVPISR